MMNIGVGSIITKGLGGPACNLLIFGGFRLYINPYKPPTPTPTPSYGGGGHGGGGGIVGTRPDYDDDREDEIQEYELIFEVKFRGKVVKRKFIVDSFKKDKIIKRVGRINNIIVKFKVSWTKVKNNRFIMKWKK